MKIFSKETLELLAFVVTFFLLVTMLFGILPHEVGHTFHAFFDALVESVKPSLPSIDED